MLFACSGPGAGAAIGRSIEIGYEHAGLLAACLLVSRVVLPRRPGRNVLSGVLFGLLVVHPAWTVGALSGDCGFFKREASWSFTIAGYVAVGWQIALLAPPRPARAPTNHNSET